MQGSSFASSACLRGPSRTPRGWGSWSHRRRRRRRGADSLPGLAVHADHLRRILEGSASRFSSTRAATPRPRGGDRGEGAGAGCGLAQLARLLERDYALRAGGEGNLNRHEAGAAADDLLNPMRASLGRCLRVGEGKKGRGRGRQSRRGCAFFLAVDKVGEREGLDISLVRGRGRRTHGLEHLGGVSVPSPMRPSMICGERGGYRQVRSVRGRGLDNF